MKVQCLNSSALKTRNLIKKTFAQILHEKKELRKVTVTELVKKADITRSTFYTHYDNIYEVAEEYKMQTLDLVCNKDLVLYTKEDILNYFDTIFQCLKENEETYQLLITSNDSLFFLDTLRVAASDKISHSIEKIYPNSDYQLTVSFLVNGVMNELISYFRGNSTYTLDELLNHTKEWFKKLFS